MRFLVIILMASGLVAQVPGSAGKKGVAEPPGNAGNGKKLFVSYGCYECHGYIAQGGAGPRLAPQPIAFTAFSKYIRQPTGEMPPYTAKVVSSQDLADIYTFLRSIPAPPSAKSLPLLNP